MELKSLVPRKSRTDCTPMFYTLHHWDIEFNTHFWIFGQTSRLNVAVQS